MEQILSTVGATLDDVVQLNYYIKNVSGIYEGFDFQCHITNNSYVVYFNSISDLTKEQLRAYKHGMPEMAKGRFLIAE